MRSPTTPASQRFLAVRTRLEPRVAAVIVVIAAVIIAVSAAIAWDGTVPDWEAEPLEWIVGWPDWLEPGFWVVQQMGVLFAPVVTGLVVVWFTRRWWHLLPFVLILPLKLSVEKAIVKQLVERERPGTSLGFDIDVRGPQVAGLSFPSGHATTAVATAVLLAAFLPPKWRPVPLAGALITCIARMYYGEHNLLDVIAGAAMGTAFAVVLWAAFLNRDVTPDAESHDEPAVSQATVEERAP